jgi:hypothetical protein
MDVKAYGKEKKKDERREREKGRKDIIATSFFLLLCGELLMTQGSLRFPIE